MTNFGMCFAKDFSEPNPLSHIGSKLPTYLQLLTSCQRLGWNVYCVTKKTYRSDGVFEGAWQFDDGKFNKITLPLKMDLVFDWTNGLEFPPQNDSGLNVVDSRKFKEICNDKWLMYQKLSRYMAHSYWVGENQEDLSKVLRKIKGDWIVLKPTYGLKGKGIFVGTKEDALNFKFEGDNSAYIAQEFVDTSGGIVGITSGRHDLRVVIINGKVAWCHVRTPPEGTYKANVGQGGSLTEVDYQKVPDSVKKVVKVLSAELSRDYDNPLFSIDFGVDPHGQPFVFEINDQIGFPRPDAQGKDVFIRELVENFKTRI